VFLTVVIAGYGTLNLRTSKNGEDQMLRISQENDSINFVDSNNVVVGFDTMQDCCEWATAYIIGSDGKCIFEMDEWNNKEIIIEGMEFDPSYFEELTGLDCDGGGAVGFRLIKGEEEFMLVLKNVHNGYYQHGFSMKVGEEVVMEDSI
jgi:hypothetical protein